MGRALRKTTWPLAAACFVWAMTATGTLAVSGSATAQRTSDAADPLDQLETVAPRQSRDVDAARAQVVERAATQVELRAEALVSTNRPRAPNELVDRVRELGAAKIRVDAVLDRTLHMRSQWAANGAGPASRDAVRHYLRICAKLIDSSGRLRYLLYDALYEIASELAAFPPQQDQLIDVLIQQRSSIGAAVMSEALFDPALDAESVAPPASLATKRKVLELIAITGQVDLLPALAEFISDPRTPPELVIAASETVRRIGLPQEPRPNQDPTLPQPVITARTLHEVLSAIPVLQIAPALAQRHGALLDWLKTCRSQGISRDRYQLGCFEVCPGDWLLMRNPSPYNRFTDLSPGLFTHVGVVAIEDGRDGIHRMVVVDLPERGRAMQATNIDTFVQRTLHYAVLRHEDASVSRTMGQRAQEAIGISTEFDLNFRTERVSALRGQPLAGKTIHTYCAGLLLLCAQETGEDRTSFFPIPEYPAGGKTGENLAQLGLTFGRNFISPTGAFFSPHLTFAGRREPMYEPRREIEEVIYDHFAQRLIERKLTLSPDLAQSLRMKLVEAAASNPLLARAIADTAGVDRNLDLVAAAKALTVVESLDQIATSCSGQFLQARQALRSGPLEELAAQGMTHEQVQQTQDYRRRHARLFEAWQAEELAPRELRVELVKFYCEKGKRELDQRFFGEAPRN